MRFKRAFSVLFDNISTTYKLLLYKLIVIVIAFGAVFATLYPVVSDLFASTQWEALISSVKEFITQFFNGNMGGLGEISSAIKGNFEGFLNLLATMRGNIIFGVILVIFIYTLHNFLTGLGNYAAAAVINDKMTLQANSPFIGTFIKNLASACKYNALYAPLSVLYDLLVLAISYLLFFVVLNFLPLLIKLSLCVAVIIFAVAIKKSYTVSWIPEMIVGQKKCIEAFKSSVTINAKQLWIFIAEFSFINILIVAITVSFAICTVGVALIICIPASALFILCYQFVYYFDSNNLKYFTDENTIIKPKKEHKLTREEFFNGEQQ